MRSGVQEEGVPLPGPHSAHKVPPPFAESPKHNHEPETQNEIFKYSQDYLPKQRISSQTKNSFQNITYSNHKLRYCPSQRTRPWANYLLIPYWCMVWLGILLNVCHHHQHQHQHQGYLRSGFGSSLQHLVLRLRFGSHCHRGGDQQRLKKGCLVLILLAPFMIWRTFIDIGTFYNIGTF